jgi:SAM-dependent methyltransferase
MLRTLPAERRQSIAVVGLGIGSIAAYESAPQKLTYFEIDPVVRDIAENSGHFTFIKAARDRGADVKIILGDARLTLADVPDESFDLLCLDAFSGDSIPMHLLTRESFELIRKKLKPHGVLAVHISNTYLDLRTTIANLAADAGCVCLYRDDRTISKKDDDERKLGSQWTALAKSRDDFGELANDARWIELPPDARYAVWTDDFSNILSVLRWKARQK